MHHDKRILLVEDDLNLGLLLMDYLESEGLQVCWRRDGLGGLQQARRQPFDLCILDVTVPVTVAVATTRKGANSTEGFWHSLESRLTDAAVIDTPTPADLPGTPLARRDQPQ